MPVWQKAVEIGERMVACRYDEQTGKWVILDGRADLNSGTLNFRTRHLSNFAAFETVCSFDDVTAIWAKEPVEILAFRVIIYGKAKGILILPATLTGLTSMVIRALYVKPLASSRRFSDVDKGACYA